MTFELVPASQKSDPKLSVKSCDHDEIFVLVDPDEMKNPRRIIEKFGKLFPHQIDPHFFLTSVWPRLLKAQTVEVRPRKWNRGEAA